MGNIRRRFNIGPDGILTDRHGTVGRVVSLVLEFSEEPRGKGGEEVPSQQQTLAVGSSDAVDNTTVGGAGGRFTGEPAYVPTEGILTQQTNRIWAHYQEKIPGASRQKLEAKRTTIIRNALAVRDLNTCLKAIDGLACSPHHNGQNEQRKKFLGLRYALAGIGKESNDERIDKMAALASPNLAGLAGLPSAGREMVRTRQRQVEAMLLNPGDVSIRTRGVESQEFLLKQFHLTAVVRDGFVVWERTT